MLGTTQSLRGEGGRVLGSAVAAPHSQARGLSVTLGAQVLLTSGPVRALCS